MHLFITNHVACRFLDPLGTLTGSDAVYEHTPSFVHPAFCAVVAIVPIVDTIIIVTNILIIITIIIIMCFSIDVQPFSVKVFSQIKAIVQSRTPVQTKSRLYFLIPLLETE